MRHTWLALLFTLAVSAAAQTAPATPPDTPAGHVLAAWLTAFNSMDRAQVEHYIQQYDPKNNPDGILGFAQQTGGFVLLTAESAGPLTVHFSTRERGGTTVGAGVLTLKSADPPAVDHLTVRAVPPNAVVEWKPIDAAERQRVLAGIRTNLDKFYVHPDVAKAMTAAVEQKAKHGDYDQVTDGFAFADRLTEDLRAVSHDGHLAVTYSPARDDGKEEHGPDAAQLAAMRKGLERENCGFQKVEILPRNVGYLKLNFFGDPAVCGPIAASAMSFLARTDALIFDLRENHGGDPHMVQTVASYLFATRTHLNDLVDRAAKKTDEYWTLADLPAPRQPKVPVFVLTSHQTFSGGEEFTYDLQTQKRATIVGETTGGGAHPVSGHRIDEHFGIGVPFAYPVNPVTKKDWEGTGVVPDVQVPAADALTKAQALAAEKLDHPAHTD